MKIGPKATQNHEKGTLEITEIQLLRKLLFATLLMTKAMFGFPIPDIQIQTQKQQKMKPGNKHGKKHFLIQDTQQTFKMKSLSHKKSIKI